MTKWVGSVSPSFCPSRLGEAELRSDNPLPIGVQAMGRGDEARTVVDELLAKNYSLFAHTN